jgi:hypothetical protein
MWQEVQLHYGMGPSGGYVLWYMNFAGVRIDRKNETFARTK